MLVRSVVSSHSVHTPFNYSIARNRCDCGENDYKYKALVFFNFMQEIDTPRHTLGRLHFLILSLSHAQRRHPGQPSQMVCIVHWNPASNQANIPLEPPSGQIRMATPQAMQFAASIFSSVSSVFPSKYISTRGDELNTQCFTSDNQTQAVLKASGQTIEQALNSFTQATHGALRSAGKTPIVWEEMVLDH